MIDTYRWINRVANFCYYNPFGSWVLLYYSLLHNNFLNLAIIDNYIEFTNALGNLQVRSMMFSKDVRNQLSQIVHKIAKGKFTMLRLFVVWLKLLFSEQLSTYLIDYNYLHLFVLLGFF